MNLLLFASSLIFGFSHCIYVFQILSHHIYFYSVLLGVVTSVLNHGSNSLLFKYMDRFAMYCLFVYNLYLCFHFWLLSSLFCLISAVVSYICAKRTNNSKFHIMSHIWVSLNNVLVSNYFLDCLGLANSKFN